jgi:hypothetical protein
MLPATSSAYRLPAYTIPVDDDFQHHTAEEVLQDFQNQRDVLRMAFPAQCAAEQVPCKVRIAPQARAALARYEDLAIPFRFWNFVVDLKQRVLALQPDRKSVV